ncbi:unnamed protein product [Rhizopus microsporus]
MNLINMLRFYKVIPLVVFDGQPLPMKQETNSKRAQKREEAYKTGLKLISDNKTKEALPYFQQSTSITQDMIQQVIKKLDEVGVQHIVAPYEADAQLAYLMKKNYVQAVVTEDSDLLAFGCSTVIFKLNRYGDCERIFFNDIPQVINIKPFTTTTLRHICMLSGCDYIPSLKGIGLKTAEALLRTHTTIEKVMRALRYKSSVEQYQQDFERAEYAFLYQYVYDTNMRDYVRLNELPENANQNHLLLLGTHPEQTKPKDVTNSELASLFYDKESNKENIPPWLKYGDKCTVNGNSSPSGSGTSSVTAPSTVKSDKPATKSSVAKFSLSSKFKALTKDKPLKKAMVVKNDVVKDVVELTTDSKPSLKRAFSFTSQGDSQENQDDYPSSLPSLSDSASTLSSQEENIKPLIRLGKRKSIDATINLHVNKKRVLDSSTNVHS